MNDHDNRPQNDTAPDTAQPDTAAAAPKASTSLDRELAEVNGSIGALADQGIEEALDEITGRAARSTNAWLEAEEKPLST